MTNKRGLLKSSFFQLYDSASNFHLNFWSWINLKNISSSILARFLDKIFLKRWLSLVLYCNINFRAKVIFFNKLLLFEYLKRYIQVTWNFLFDGAFIFFIRYSRGDMIFDELLGHFQGLCKEKKLLLSANSTT